MAKEPTGIDKVAPGTSGEVVDFAQLQIFSAAGKIGQVPDGLPRRSPQHVLCGLLDGEINAGLQTFAFDDFRVWIGDELNGYAPGLGPSLRLRFNRRFASAPSSEVHRGPRLQSQRRPQALHLRH